MNIHFSVSKFIEENKGINLMKLYDFLISEISKDTLLPTIEYIMCTEEEEISILQDDLYRGTKYEGVLCEGNQYLIKKMHDKVLVIDAVAEEYCSDHSITRFELLKSDFVEVIQHKERVLELIKDLRN
ncbi:MULTISPECIES: hypothetical protein [Paenibacillus]|uniref:hypothetical protein n=1 Tax=Paenibacillus TaxID=44249 RepID=UPI001F1F118C|nr:hypothetical protein [Paenibacillus sp. JJ-223]CAH1226396.1 hypothetical protein PAECIP111890_05919 [Paenibacillus sp. JJ-223]